MASHTFLVVCMGRSGSKWLARELNRASPDPWKVKHEPREPFPFRKRTHYGVVDGFRVRKPEKIMHPDSVLGVIVRKPIELARSAIIRKPWKWRRGYLKNLKFTLMLLERHIAKPGTVLIRFERMTRDPEYLTDIATKLGIDEFDASKVDWNKCNASRPGVLNPKIADQVMAETEWFFKKWWGDGDELSARTGT